MNEVVDLALGFLNEDSDDEYLEEEIPEEDIPAQNDAVDTANPILDEPVSSVNPETDISVTQMMNQTKSPSEGILDLVDSTNTFQRAEENPNTDEPTFSATKDADSGVVDQQPEVITQSIPDNDGQEAPPAGESISKPKKEDQGEEAAQSESRLDVVPENNEQMVDARFPNNETGNTHYSAEDALVSPTVAAQRSLEYRANKNLYNLCVNCHFPLLKSSPGAMRIHRERCNRDSTFKLECKALYKPSPPKEPSAMRTIITPVSQRGRGHRQWPPSPPTSSVPRPPPPQSVLKVPNSGFTPLQNVGESFHFFPQGIRNDSASSVPPTRFGPLPAPSSPSTSSVNANPPATQAFGIGPTSPNAFQFRPTVESSVQSTPNDQQKTVRKKLTPLKILKAKLASLEKDLEAENEVLILEFTGHGPDDPARELQEDTISKLQAEIDELREQIKAAQGSKGGEGPPT
ncbi:hypothetical protein P154DRAFT_540984 [Amniculicola lignicola CBS 123094]|uniref:Uncharacterized protein n=1 Tax=Amniculicola lignicola CBS 123094 TaxID=1392246 RepID=A0A6A5VV31_9PLEO|nr:hypothetical protein P154DRAFT_540984 [Amniculicola lignicola CBS 123094]